MNPITELGLSPKSHKLIDEICQRKNPVAVATIARDNSDVTGINLGYGPAITAADEKRLRLLRSEMNADDTSPKMRAQFARASLRARGLDLFAAPPGGK